MNNEVRLPLGFRVNNVFWKKSFSASDNHAYGSLKGHMKNAIYISIYKNCVFWVYIVMLKMSIFILIWRETCRFQKIYRLKVFQNTKIESGCLLVWGSTFNPCFLGWISSPQEKIMLMDTWNDICIAPYIFQFILLVVLLNLANFYGIKFKYRNIFFYFWAITQHRN